MCPFHGSIEYYLCDNTSKQAFTLHAVPEYRHKKFITVCHLFMRGACLNREASFVIERICWLPENFFEV